MDAPDTRPLDRPNSVVVRQNVENVPNIVLKGRKAKVHKVCDVLIVPASSVPKLGSKWIPDLLAFNEKLRVDDSVRNFFACLDKVKGISHAISIESISNLTKLLAGTRHCPNAEVMA